MKWEKGRERGNLTNLAKAFFFSCEGSSLYVGTLEGCLRYIEIRCSEQNLGEVIIVGSLIVKVELFLNYVDRNVQCAVSCARTTFSHHQPERQREFADRS